MSDVAALTERTIVGLHDHLVSRLPVLAPNAPILDVGCGTGAWLHRLSRAGFTNLWGIDRDLAGLSFTGARTAVADLDTDHFPFGEQKFDLITAIEVIEHLENQGRLYRLFANHLSENGVALVTTPNIHSLVARLRHLVTGKVGQFDEKGDPTHISPLLIDGVLRVVPRYALAVQHRWGYPARGSLVYRRPLQLASRLLGTRLPDLIPGDTLCLLLGRDLHRAAASP